MTYKPTVKPTVRILILAANPIGTAQVRLDEEVQEIEAGLQRAAWRERLEIRSDWAIRPVDVRRALLSFKPEIVHFSGHGGVEGLVLADETGQAKEISAAALASLFELFSDQVKCVVLNAFYSEEQAQAIHQHIEYVIGISPALGDRTAIQFAVGFYDALGAGLSYEQAYQFGYARIKMSGFPEGSMPVLLSRAVNRMTDTDEVIAPPVSPSFSPSRLSPVTDPPTAAQRVSTRLSSRAVPVRQSSFLERGDRVVVMAAGGAAIGALFGHVPGVIIGTVLGAIYGWYSSNEKTSPGRKI